MANVKISDMSAAGVLDGTEVVAGVQVGANVKVTTAAIAGLAGGGSAAGPAGTVQMSDGAGAFVVSDFIDDLTTPGAATIRLVDAAGALGGPGSLVTGTGVSFFTVAPPEGEAGVGIAFLEGYGPGADPSFGFVTAGGVVGAPTEVLSGAPMGGFAWQGFDGTSDWANAGHIHVTAESDFSGTPTTKIDITNASDMGLHIAANGTLTVDHGIVAGTGTATATAGAVTLNQVAGIVTSEALVAAVTYTLTLTNSFVSASSVVMVIPIASSGIAMPITSVTAGSGSVAVVVTSAALTGTIKFMFQVCN